MFLFSGLGIFPVQEICCYSKYCNTEAHIVFVRRTMLFMAFAILGLCPFIFAFFEDIPVAVETLEQSGGWLWGLIPEKESFAVAYVKGFYLADVWKELMANLISAYIGAGITRKAFSIGR